MMLFSTGTGLKRVGVVGSDLDCWWVGMLDARSSVLNRDCNNGDLLALGVALLYKNKKKGGSARASPVVAPMPKSVSFLEKRETAQRANVLAYEFAYLSPMGWPCIYS